MPYKAVDVRGRFAILLVSLACILGTASAQGDELRAGRAASAPQLAQGGSAPPIVLVTGIDPAYCHYVVAVRKGFFERQGLRAELKSFDDGNVALDSLLTGAGDIGGTSEPGGLARWARGGQLFVVASGAQSEKFFLLAGKNTIQNPKDLESKTIGVPRGSGAHLFMGKYLKHYSVNLDKITFRYLQAPESVAALSRGDIDALFLWEPWISRAITATPNTRIIEDSSKSKVYSLNVYIYFSQRLMQNEDVAKKALLAIVQAAEWIPANQEETAKLVADEYRMTPAVVAQLMGNFKWDINFSSSIKENFVDAAEFVKSLGVIKETPDIDKFLRPEVLRAAAPYRVTVQ